MGMELWWLGQAGFRLRAAGTNGPIVFVDPYLLERPDRSWQAPLSPAELADQADFVLCTHEHRDHFDRGSLEAAALSPDAHFTLVVPEPLVEDALALGLPRERVVGMQPGARVVTATGVAIHAVPARHGVNVADAYTFGEELPPGLVRYLGYVVELGEVRAYHAGDCIPYAGQVEQLRALAPHLALLPINGRDFFRETERNLVGNMDPREAARLASEIGADVLVPMHWELFGHNRGYTGDLAAYTAETFPELTLVVMGRGARITYAPPTN